MTIRKEVEEKKKQGMLAIQEEIRNKNKDFLFILF